MKKGRPKGPRSRFLRTPARDHGDDAERALFLNSLDALDEIPDKDARTPAPNRPLGSMRRRPVRRSQIEPDAVLDLHGMKAEEARHALGRFVQSARHRGDSHVLVITGKGLRSEGGKSVLKLEVERWIRRAGTSQVEAWSEAPRRLGGRGAYLLELRR